jgi:diguanylate cyclase (GGDEF)-like protein
MRHLGYLQFTELLAYDQMVRLHVAVEPDPRLLVVSITEDDIRSQKRWPISDAVVARLLATLQNHYPRAIGLDLYRDVPQDPGNAALSQQLQANNVITVFLMKDTEKAEVLPPAGVSPDRVGFSDILLDPDGVVRRNLLYVHTQPEQLSFALQVSLKYLEPKHLTVRVASSSALQIGNKTLPILTPSSGGYESLDDRGYQILLNYRAGNNLAQQVTMSQVLNGQVNPEWINDKLVLIGTTAPSLKDLFLTPYNLSSHEKSPTTPGVMVHAQMVSQILRIVLDNQPLIWFWSNQNEMLWIWAWALIGGVLAWRFRHPFLLSATIAIATGGLMIICFGIFTQAGWIPLIPAAMALIGTGIAVVGYKRLYDTFHDALTGLPNRALFIKQLQIAIARHQQSLASSKQTTSDTVAVLCLGLDGFKAVNDSFGHRLGDQLLVKMMQRLQGCLRSTDQLARVGGDEFAILQRRVTSTEEVTELADRLQKQVTRPFKLDGREVFATVSVGIVLGRNSSTYEPENLLRDAHTAMHRAKASGKARHEVFVTGMRDQVVTRLQLETDLRYAIERQEFRLYYQPLICLTTGAIAGFEALVRWQHPQRGFVSPVDFISVAEDTDLIIPLGQWILREACHQVRIWQEQFPQQPSLVMSVNLSGKQFSQPNLVEQVEQTLWETGLDGHSLKLEITESTAMTDVESTIALLLRLKALHLQISIDDFGTGYSSLSYLHRFPSNTIKVDRSFVSRMGYASEDAHIVQTIIMLGHNLHMDIVAEGVETAEQLDRLRALHCEYGQGYFFSKPVTADAIAALLTTNPHW